MRDLLLKLQSQFQKHWQNLSAQQKIIIFFFSLVILSSLIAVSFYVARPNYVPLFTNLTPEDASGIVNRLRESNITFQVTDGGGTIRVPAKDVYETRISLAAQGLPQGGSIGFEIFDKNIFGMTEFAQRLNFKRALQGELERTIRQISAVEQARVHLVMPEKELYFEKEKEPTASVILKLKPGDRLDRGQIRAILNLVKTSVEGLKENNISIIDTNGTLLSRAWEETDSAFSPEIVSSHYELKKRIEKSIEEDISTMLRAILGPGKAVVRATAELDMVKRESTEESYSPVVNENREGGIIRSQQRKSEHFKGSGSTPGAGTPGTAANIGNVPGYQQVQAGGGTSDYTKEESITNYEINKKVAHLISVPGEVKKLSVAVLLDGDFAEDMINTIKQAVSSGIGLNPERGDRVVVESIAFDRTYMEKEKQEMEIAARKELFAVGLRTGIIIFVVLIILLFSLSMLRHLRVMKKATDGIRKTQEALPQGNISLAAGPAESGISSQEINRQVEYLANEKPQKVAEAIRDLLSR